MISINAPANNNNPFDREMNAMVFIAFLFIEYILFMFCMMND